MSSPADGHSGSAGTPGHSGLRLTPSSLHLLGLVAVVAMGLNLRAGAVTAGPVLAELSAELGLGPVGQGLLTSMPSLLFAVSGPLSAVLLRRLTVTWTLALACAGIAGGLIGRSLTPSAGVFLTLSALAFACMGVGNVVLPAYIKLAFPLQVPGVMSAYSTSLAVSSLVPGLVTGVLVAESGWRGYLGLWGLAASLAVLPWLVMGVHDRRRFSTGKEAGPALHLLRSRKALALCIFFGVQSMQAYTVFGWLPQILRDAGHDPAYAARMVALYSALGIPGSLIIPVLLGRLRRTTPLIIGFGLGLALGHLALLLIPQHAWIAAVLLGISGFAFPAALLLITARTRDPRITAQVSALTQSFGYLIAAVGPLSMGLLHSATGGWTVPILTLAATGSIMIAAGTIAARPGFIDDELAPA